MKLTYNVTTALLLGATLPVTAIAQGYPDKAVRVVVPFPAGGAADIVARQLTTRLSDVIGQQVIVDNRGGAGGAIGADNVARAAPDGYSLLFASSSVLSINPHLGRKTPYDILTSFTPVVLIGHAPNVLTVHPSVPVKTVKDLIAFAKAKPGELAYASNGAGTLSHLTGELFSQRAGVNMLHVPHKGGAPAVIDTVAGNVSVLFAAYPTVSGQMRAGRLKALAVTSAKRIAIAPELPTVAEAAIKGFESSQWWGLYGPAGLAATVVNKVNAAANKVLATDDIKKHLAVDGAAPAGGTPADLAKFHKADYDKWGGVMAKAGLKKTDAAAATQGDMTLNQQKLDQQRQDPAAGATMQFAEFAAGLDYAALPATVQEHLTIFLLDFLRVASLGQRMNWSAWATNLAREAGGSPHATVLFSTDRTDPERATFVNSTYAGSIDADDVHVGSMLHPGCIVISAALAIGEARGIAGDRIFAAIAAGYENMIRIGLAIQPSHFKRGFQSTATCGGFGAGTAAASLLFTGKDRATRIAETIGLVASFSGGLTQFYHSGSTVKRIHAAHAAGEGIHAALLAEAGFSGPTDILEGKDGFARAYADGHDFSKGLDQIGSNWRLLETAIKPHARSARVLSAVEATASLCQEHQLTLADIKTIRVGIPKIIQGRLTTPAPTDIQAAQMSLPFCMAMVLSRGKDLQPGFTMNVDDFEATLADPQVMAVSQRIECVLDPEAERVSTEQSVGAKVTLTLQSGAAYERFIEAPRGSASRPFTMDDHVARFKQEMLKRFSAVQVAALLEEIRGFAKSPNPGHLMHLLAGRE